ncbi:NAD-dependent epimerase/dehydratase family protein [Vibrio cyclitrophicus]
MRILITGSTGFLGTHLLSSFKESGFEVVCLTRGEPDPRRTEIQYDSFFDGLNKFDPFDICFHLAGCAHRHFTDKEVEDSDINLTKKLINACSLNGVDRFVYVSTANINFDLSNSGTSEPVGRTSFSSNTTFGKYLSELYLLDYCKNKPIQLSIVRLPLVYGPGVKANFAQLIKLSKSNVALPFKAFKHRRSYLSVYNFCDFMNHCILSERVINRTVTISDLEKVSFTRMLDKLSYYNGASLHQFFLPKIIIKTLFNLLNRKGSYKAIDSELVLDSSHYLESLEWVPKFTLDESLELMSSKESNSND